MKNKPDPALSVPYPRLISSVYFTLLAVLATIVANGMVYLLGFPQIIAFYQAMLLSVLLGSIFGALFGKRILRTPIPFKKTVFWSGFEMVFSALPFYTAGFMWIWLQRDDFLALYTIGIWDHLKLYGFILFYCAILSTIWMAIASGFAAIYLRARLVYYILDNQQDLKHKALHRHAH